MSFKCVAVLAMSRRRQGFPVMRRPPLQSGDRYGSVVVMEYDPDRHGWKCKCDCGAIIYKVASWLSPTSSCAQCYRKRGGWKGPKHKGFDL